MEIFIENIQDKIEITDEILELMEKAIKCVLNMKSLSILMK